eukprot:321764-Chlamydomonas_euryale.AAC.2
MVGVNGPSDVSGVSVCVDGASGLEDKRRNRRFPGRDPRRWAEDGVQLSFVYAVISCCCFVCPSASHTTGSHSYATSITPVTLWAQVPLIA